MTYILQANDENGMSQEEIESNSQVLIDAGTETVATALSGRYAAPDIQLQSLMGNRNLLLSYPQPPLSPLARG